MTVQDVDEPPVFSAPLTNMVVSEDARVGTSIGKVSAYDPDTSNNAIRYRKGSHTQGCSRQPPWGGPVARWQEVCRADKRRVAASLPVNRLLLFTII